MATIPARFPTQLMDRTLAYLNHTGDMILHIEMVFAQQLDPARLARAAYLALTAEPILGCQLVHDWRMPHWARITATEQDVFVVADSEATYEAFKVMPIDTHNGPRIRLCLWPAPNGDYLLLKVCHYVADAAGARDAARTIATIYNQLDTTPTYQPTPNLNGVRSPTPILARVPWYKYPNLLGQAMRDNQAWHTPAGTQTLPIPDGPAEGLMYPLRHLSRERVAALVAYGRHHQATINDLLIAAFFRALVSITNWQGNTQLRMNTTVDFRRYVPDKHIFAVANLSAAIQGWPNLGTTLGANFAATLQRVASITRPRKQHFLGLDALLGLMVAVGALPHQWAKGFVATQIKAQDKRRNIANGLTNLGPVETRAVTFGTRPIKAHILPPPVYPPYLMLGASGYDGTLTLSAGVYQPQHQMAAQFLDAMMSEFPC